MEKYTQIVKCINFILYSTLKQASKTHFSLFQNITHNTTDNLQQCIVYVCLYV